MDCFQAGSSDAKLIRTARRTHIQSIFRDLGLATICARGLLGEEYMDRDEFRDADDVMVVLGEKDRIVPADSLYQSFVQEEAFGKGNRLIWLPGAMHGESGLRLAVAAEIDAFFCA